MANVFTTGRGLNALKSAFFDRQKVTDAVGKANRRVMSKAGAFVRRRAQTSIRPRKDASQPGQPPSSHSGILRRFIFFAYDQDAGGVVVGPMKTNQVFFGRDRKPVTGTVPQVLEYGGSITILEVFKWGSWRRADLRSKRRNAGMPTRYRTVEIKARPFMHPALDKERPKFAEMFKNAVSAAGAR